MAVRVMVKLWAFVSKDVEKEDLWDPKENLSKIQGGELCAFSGSHLLQWSSGQRPDLSENQPHGTRGKTQVGLQHLGVRELRAVFIEKTEACTLEITPSQSQTGNWLQSQKPEARPPDGQLHAFSINPLTYQMACNSCIRVPFGKISFFAKIWTSDPQICPQK